MKTVLVTGGAGFLGSHLCDRLIDAGDRVICVDDFSTGSKDNIAHLLSHPDFALIEHDIIMPLAIQSDEIYNLACPASPPAYQLDPIRTTKICVMGTLNLLELAAANGSTFFQASTSEIYGDPVEHPQTESYFGNVNPIGPRSCYDEGKRCAETLCFDFHRSRGTDVKVVRIFNTYGPRMSASDGRVVTNFIVQALRNEPITIYGNGEQTRSFCYVDDMVDGFMRLMATGPDIQGPVNIGNPGEFTMIELADIVIEMTGSSSKLIHMPLPIDDPRQRRPDISAAIEKLNWTPTMPLRDGLKRTIEYLRKAIKSAA